jgi:hypothetical protein
MSVTTDQPVAQRAAQLGGPARRQCPAVADQEQATVNAPGRPRGRAGAARTGRGRLRPGREQASVTAPGCSHGRARCHLLKPGGSGRVGLTLHSAPTRVGGLRLAPLGPGHGGHNRAAHGVLPVLDRRSRIAAAVSALAVMDCARRAAGRTAGPAGLPCVERRGLRPSHCGDGGLDLLAPAP